MGTTRMARDPRRGVTDADTRVHGMGNLYVAGSSLFPTSGWANPTLTIVALALRTADEVSRALSRGAAAVGSRA
jgi:choline dehydrogenase-like flavoprotein